MRICDCLARCDRLAYSAMHFDIIRQDYNYYMTNEQNPVIIDLVAIKIERKCSIKNLL